MGRSCKTIMLKSAFYLCFMHIVAIGGLDDFKHMVRMRKALADRV